MTLRSPRSRADPAQDGALGYEIAQEQAAALGRLGRALEAALAALAQHDRAGGKIDGDATNCPHPPARCGSDWSRRPATPCGALSFSGRLAAFVTKAFVTKAFATKALATKGRSFGNTAFRRKCGTVWGRSAAGAAALRVNEFILS